VRRGLGRQLDGATTDWTVSGDAMRWSPERADSPEEPRPPVAFPGIDVAAGLGSVLGLDGPTVRRLVAGALASMTMVASDMADEVRGWPGELRGLREGVRHRLDRGQRPG
jgi:serine/threonine-protein kinase RsbW